MAPVWPPNKDSTSKTAESGPKMNDSDLEHYLSLDVEELLAKLSPEELKELNAMVDPDDSYLPPAERCSYHTDKTPTGKLNRAKLLEFLVKKAKEDPEWEEKVPYEKKTRGTVWKPKERKNKDELDKDDIPIELDEEFEEALRGASEKDLVDLAAILGFHGMLNQVQYNAVHEKLKRGEALDEEDIGGTEFQSVVKSEKLKLLPPEPDNTTDVEASIAQVANNDAALKELNWNNIRDISVEKFQRLFEALAKNTKLEKLTLANTRMTDACGRTVLEEALKTNTTLKVLNVESNFLSGEYVRDLVQALLEKQTLVEFRASNQSPLVLGNQIEMAIADAVCKNKGLMKLGIAFESAGPRVKCHNHLQRINDEARRKRMDA